MAISEIRFCRLWLLTLLSAVVLLPTGAHAFERTVDFNAAMVYALPAGLTQEEARIAVKLGLVDRKWAYQKGEGDSLIAVLDKSSAMIKMRVEHSLKDVTFHYMESRGLEYDGVTIHKSYKRWLDSLASDMQTEAKRLLIKRGAM